MIPLAAIPRRTGNAAADCHNLLDFTVLPMPTCSAGRVSRGNGISGSTTHNELDMWATWRHDRWNSGMLLSEFISNKHPVQAAGRFIAHRRETYAAFDEWDCFGDEVLIDGRSLFV